MNNYKLNYVYYIYIDKPNHIDDRHGNISDRTSYNGDRPR